jgi:1,6-anhydro-N-acetylmuramate kinase
MLQQVVKELHWQFMVIHFIFEKRENRIMLNMGGIANFTIYPQI